MKMHGYSTHQALLTAAMLATDGDIIEMGGGWYSTPLVNAVATLLNRRAATVETGEFVYNILKRYNSDCHQVSLLEGFDFDDIGKFKARPGMGRAGYIALQQRFLDGWWDRFGKGRKLSVAFVDQAPGFLRVPAIQFLADKAEFIVSHDTEHVEHYGLEPTYSSFRFRWDFILHKPESVVLSNTRDCSCFSFLHGEP